MQGVSRNNENYISKSLFITELSEFLYKKDLSKDVKVKLSNLILKEFNGLELDIAKSFKSSEIKDLELIVLRKKCHEFGINIDLSASEFHDPMKTIKFLFKFCTDDQFKWFTHPKEMDFDYNELLNVMDSLKKTANNFSLNQMTKAQVLNFIEYSDQYLGWDYTYTQKKTRFAWTSLDIKKWCYENQGLYPSNAQLNQKELNESGIKDFGSLINAFKHSIEFRTDDVNKTFDAKIRNLLRNTGVRNDFKVLFSKDYENISKSLHTYVDVIRFLVGLKQILDWIVQHKVNSTSLNIDLKEYSDCYVLELFHVESEIKYSINDSKIRRAGGEMGKVRSYFYQNCDWTIEAKFNEGDYRLILLEKGLSPKSLNNEVLPIEIIDPVGGVKHLIKIYKTIGL
jgi:hypothetical protein